MTSPIGSAVGSVRRWTIAAGDVRECAPLLEAQSFDGVLTDPPYELGFMGKRWDASGVAFDPSTWREILRVCKPGAHMLAFGGSRTMHRITCAIEDAGFEIRDSMQWLYGSGFPKSLDVSKALDKAAGVEREVIATWHGYGTALKPAHEPIVLARAPLDGTVAANVTRWGCGALAIDACRIGDDDTRRRNTAEMGYHGGNVAPSYETGSIGRWPSNVLLDEVAAAELDAQSGASTWISFPEAAGAVLPLAARAAGGYADVGGASRFFYTTKATRADRDHGLSHVAKKSVREMVGREPGSAGCSPRAGAGRSSGAANVHPTVKPTDLLEYLARLILPPRRSTPRRLFVPFAGSGSEMIAAIRAGWDEVVGVELEYAELARERLEHADTAHQTDLFEARNVGGGAR